MTCVEFEELLPDVLEGERNAEQIAHLKACSSCAGLVSDLEVIFREARQLEGMHEPSPRIWNSIEIALRQEGLIREPRPEPAPISVLRHGWRPSWVMAPLLAMLVIGFALVHERDTTSRQVTATNVSDSAQIPSAAAVDSDEDLQLLEIVSSRAPAMRSTYENSLRHVNAYIRDAKASTELDPNDDEAQQSLMEAYEQRAMVYQMALDRSLP